MEVYESSLHDLLNESSLPNVCILGIINETTEQGLSAVRCIREAMPSKATIPVLLIAYRRSKGKGRHSEPEMEKELATLSFDLNVHRCLDCSTVNRKTMRAILMMALLAARPHICEFGSTSDLRFDDDLHKTSITATLSMPDISHRRSHKKTTIKKIFNNTTPINKLCNLQ